MLELKLIRVSKGGTCRAVDKNVLFVKRITTSCVCVAVADQRYEIYNILFIKSDRIV